MPMQPARLDLVDPYDLISTIANLNIMEPLEVNMADFDVAAEVKWLAGPRGLIELPFFWWRTHAKGIPLLMEIKDMVGKGKPRSSKIPRGNKRLALVRVREKTVLVPNDPRHGSLALKGHAGAEPGSFEDDTGVMGWFLTELDKDTKTFQEELVQSQAAASSSTPQAIEEGLGRLKSDSSERSATWQPSRMSFNVNGTNKTACEFKVATNMKKPSYALVEDFHEDSVERAVLTALEWAQQLE